MILVSALEVLTTTALYKLTYLLTYLLTYVSNNILAAKQF